MDDPILRYAEDRLRRPPDPWALLTLYAVLPADRWTLTQWNNALTLLTDRRIKCADYRAVGDTLRELTCE